jgi:DNA-binding IscR family transcriptional regulator
MRSSKDGVDGAVVPSRLESARAKLVYLALAGGGPATVEDLATRLNETRLALLAVLGTLEERGLVERGADGFAVA